MMRLTYPACLAGVFALLLAVGVGAGAEARELHRPHAHAAIIGGAPAASAAFPWLAEIIDVRGSEAGQCTGTVVAPRLILTAGHCVENMRTGTPRQASGFTVLTFAGATATGEPNVSTVSGVIAYDGFKRGVDDGDAALLALSAPVGAPVIPLATSAGADQPTAGTPATIVGWGRTSFTQRAPSEALHSAATAVQASPWCKRHAPPFFARGELCALDPPSYATGACNGDSGGPLLTAGASGEPVEVGIAVHVYRRCSTRRPTVFTSVSSLAPWLASWIAAYAVP
ncbi:MAG TPA: trypsin-like serine protease [Solirubrobacteraceae bacterium]|jgi:secreted trypsin-like serine protease|nr:trypsin-like serine protease [Solirubrobacteraceae bacterium]